MKKHLLFSILILLLVIPLVNGGVITDFRIQPNVSSTDTDYFIEEVSNLTVYYSYTDNLLNLLQDWHGAIYYNNKENNTFPQSIYHWTFDYGTARNVTDYSVSQNDLYGNKSLNLFSNPALYYPFEEVNASNITFDWSGSYHYIDGGNWTGAGVHDGTWSNAFRAWDTDPGTFATETGAGFGTIEINYTIPPYAIGAIAEGLFDFGDEDGNFTIPDGCFSGLNEGVVRLRLTAESTGPSENGWATYACFNGTEEDLIAGDEVSNSLGNRWFYTRIYWVVPEWNGQLNDFTLSNDCPLGMCLSSTTDSTSIDIDDITLNLSTGSAVSFWYKRDDVTGNDILLGRDLLTTRNYVFFSSTNIFIEGNTNGDSCRGTASSDGLFHHYAISFKDYRCTIYEDGINVTSALFPSMESDDLTINKIGGINAAPFGLNGSIDEVYFFNTTLSLSDVQVLFNHDAKSGYSYPFRNFSSINFTNTTFAVDTANYTFMFWVKRNISQDMDRQIVMGESGHGNNKFIGFVEANGGLFIEGNTNDDSCGGTYTNDSLWHHYAISISQGNCEVYEDGINTTIAASDTITSSIDLDRIGRGGAKYINALIDDVIIFNLTLTKKQVNQQINLTGVKDLGLFTTNIANGTYFANISYWNVSSSSSDKVNATTRVFDGNYTLNQLTVDDCTTNTVKILNYSYFLEGDIDAKINATSEVTGKVFYLDPPHNESTFFNVSIALSDTLTTNSLCMKVNRTLFADLKIIYTSPGGFTHNYIFRNHSFDNVTDNLSLFNYNSTSGVSDLKVTIRSEEDYGILSNIITSLQREYIGADSTVFRTVQMDETGDLGLTFFNVIEESVTYKFLFRDRLTNQIVKQTQNLKFICVDSVCDFIFTVPPPGSDDTITELFVNISYNEGNNEINATWNDPSGITSSITLVVTKETLLAKTIICRNGASGSSGVVTCDVTGQTGNIIAEVFAGASPQTPWSFIFLTINVTDLYSVLEAQGLAVEADFWAFGIISMMVVGAVIGFGAMGGVIVMGASIILISFLGLASFLNIGILVLMLALLAFVAWRGKRFGV